METVNTPAPSPAPRPGPSEPAGPDVAELRSTFDDLLADSAGSDGVNSVNSVNGDEEGGVGDHQVEALDSAHELLARALTALDSTR